MEFVSWPLGMVPAAKTPGQPEPPSPSLSVSPGPALQDAWLLSYSASFLS